MIFFNPTSYSGYASADLGNIRFYEGTTELYSWCESGCTATSSNAVFWVRIPGGIGFNAGGTANVVLSMTFLSTSTEYDGVYAGEAPQLSCTSTVYNSLIAQNVCTANYAKYDNGGNVFQSYQNFAGNSCPASWSCTNAMVANGVTVVGNGAGGSIYSPGGASFFYSGSIISDALDEWTSMLYSCSTSDGPFIGSSTGFPEGWCPSTTTYAIPFDQDGGDMGTQQHNINTLSVESLYITSASNYGSELNYVNGGIYVTSESSGNFAAAQLGSGDTAFMQWVRFRSLPLGALMPKTSFGSISH
jgi:hypothetical protein